MIQQPELGKKIADYRKAKGLTQEELVDKCNLSVRTLQRIEAGVVTPRTYTVRLIYEALDITYDNSFDSSFGENNGLILKRLEQFYINFIDLFNLKTNTMEKILILTVMVSSVVLGIFAINGNTVANDKLSAASDNQLNHSTSSILDTSMWYSYFHSEESFYDNNDLIARNIKFTSHGVTIASKLIKVNQDTREFITTFASGKLSNEKVEVFISNDIFQEISYSADMIDESYRKFHLRGNARIDAGEFRFIEAKEIIITTD